ncbi:MAG: Carboxyl-terminal protease [Candidatus Roizmanbacteria bacterium GW2011_GWB1_40_7]|nr:MAG: Carboxyl-terminal protease [Candidatus Roizmanbacteria bacterium GW2011_GWB1_40_7]
MIRTVILIIAFSLLSGGGGYWLGTHEVDVSWEGYSPQASVVNTTAPENRDVDFSLFWDVWDRLEQNYIDDEKIDPEKMVYGAIKGMTASLGDPYTVFLPPEDNEKAREDLQGEFDGIGAQLGMKDERIVVIAPLKGMPAEKAGIKSGDFIIQVDGVDTFGWTVPEAVEKIRGPKGEKVTLSVFRDGLEAPVDIEVIRDTIEVPTVETEYADTIAQGTPEQEPANFKDGVAIIRLHQFGEQTNHQWDVAVNEIIKTCNAGTVACEGVILDVRNNPGGFLDGSVYVASEFLKDGLVVTQEHSSGQSLEYTVNRKGRLLTQPLAVLINRGSASASEIVAGALKVRGRATIVGETSFGKGSVQERIELPHDAGLHVTTAKWILPDGSWINEVGVSPDIEVVDDPTTADVDEQLDKAIEVLKSKE